MIHHNGTLPPKAAPKAAGKSFLKVLRERLGDLSQEHLAREIGVSLNSISRWERGAASASLTIAQMKKFIRLTESVGFQLDQIPDDLSQPPQRQRQRRKLKPS